VWFIVTVIAAVLIIFFNALKRRLSIEIHLRHVPGPPSTNSLLGNISLLFDTPENAFKVVRKWGRDYYPIYGNWIAHLSVANIVNPYDFETILSNMVHNSKGPLYDMLHSWLGTGLLTSGGLKWQTRRKILTPSFHFNILQEFIKVFNEETANLVTRLKKDCHKPYIEVTDYISGFALNTIGETAMGTNFVDSSSGREYKNAIYDIGQVYVHRMCRPWLLNKILYFFDRRYFYEKNLVKKLHQFTNEVIAKREDNFQPIKLDTTDDFSYSKKKRLAMLDLLLTAKNQDGSIDDDGVREEVDTFMFEGHDTTSVAISYALMLLACHRDVQVPLALNLSQVLIV
jgi:cytochrome P450 family 4